MAGYGSVPFGALAELADKLAAESGRLKKRAAIAEAIQAAHTDAPEGDDAGLLALYLAGTPFPQADSRKLNAGGALLSRALLAVSGASEAALATAYRRHGDLGAAAFDLLATRAVPPTLTLLELHDAFAMMAMAKTTAARRGIVEDLLRRATPIEAKYLLKLMLGDMRIGVKQSLVEEAIGVAAGTPVADVRQAVMLEADLGAAVKMALAGTLSMARMRLFHPLGFMLASPVETPEEAIERFSTAAVEGDSAPSVQAFIEDKYDGMRAQVHCGERGRVAIYSRNREEITASFPELAEAFSRVEESNGGAIFDGEILGWDFAAGKALPFAVLGQRIGRKQVSGTMLRQVPAVFMAFDLLYAQGDLLLERTLRERRALLEELVGRAGGLSTASVSNEERRARRQAVLFTTVDDATSPPMQRLMLSPSRLVESAEAIDRAYTEARARANEGVMLKAADSIYQPGRRGMAWVKLKRELATLDVVITGAEFGHGRRAGILSDYTFAVRGPDGALLNVGKAYSGLTDAEIAALSAWCMEHTLEDQGHFRTVEPLRVLEVAFNNVMRSGRHASSFALRFPRILRIRDDKPLDEIDTVERVEEIFQSQVDKPVE